MLNRMIVGATAPSELIMTSFTEGITAVQDNVLLMIVAALPVGLLIFGTIKGIKIGIKFFGSLAK